MVAAATLLAKGDRAEQTVAQEAAVGHVYALVSWEFSNFPDKWLHRIYTALPWSNTSGAARKADLDRYIKLVGELRTARGELERVSADSTRAGLDAAAKQAEVDRLVKERDRLRNSVEEYLESLLGGVVDRQGLGAGFLTWPPVDFRQDQPPHVLITSPRHRIEREDTVLIRPETAVANMERIENRLMEQHNLSALVEATGGLSTYPTVVPSSYDLLSLLEVAAHEWLHSHLFFHPLGQHYWDSGDMTRLNETLADMAGRELGGMVYEEITGKPAPEAGPPRDASATSPAKAGEFDFFSFMRETRQRADELLKAGDVEGAEGYMEGRRISLNSHGYAVRKINQAYFAFHGSYGESPSSVSPIAREIYELRRLSGSPGELVRTMRGISTYVQFREVLASMRAAAGGS